VPPPPTLPALHRLRLAEAAYAQFRSEPGGGGHGGADWQAVLMTAHHVFLGAQWLPRFDLPVTALPTSAADREQARARALAETTDRLAALCAGEPPPPRPSRPPAEPPPGRPAPALVDLDTWLRSLAAQLARDESHLPDALRRSAHARSGGGPA
jgi:hypothetical protein